MQTQPLDSTEDLVVTVLMAVCGLLQLTVDADPAGVQAILGTLAAIGVSFVIYVLLAIWLARSATPEEMVTTTR